MRIGPAIAIGAAQFAGSSAFNLATLPLTGWWSGAYPGVSWPAEASAGTSGANGALVAGVAPPQGAPQNGIEPAAFDGATTSLVNANTTDTFVTDAAGGIFVVFKPSAAVASAGAGSRVDDPGLVVQSGGGVTWSITYSADGVCALIYDGISYKEVVLASAVGSLALLLMRWDGVNLELGINGGAMSSLACGNMTAAAGPLAVGINYSGGARFAGDVFEIGMINTTPSDADRTNIRAALSSKYAAAL